MIKKYIILSVLIAISSFIHAQQRGLITGKITDSAGVSINGATIVNLATNFTTASDTHGEFKIECVAGDSLQISHIGYNSRIIPVANSESSLSITLLPTDIILEDVTINTGYQTLKPNEVNGSYIVIDNEMLNQQTGTNILDRLKGVTSGLLVNMGKSNPNPQNSTDISIRGLSTINGPLDPLIVLDNFIYEGDINNINPADVESVTVLKDAAAASIWGARAGNGVIVITTKKGNFNQRLTVDFNSAITITGKPDLYYLPHISSSDYIDFEEFLFDKGYYNSQISSKSRPALSPAVTIFQNRKTGTISPEDATKQINELKQIDNRAEFMKYFYRKGLLQQNALSVSGGTTNLAWLISGTYDRNVNNIHTKFEKINLRFENIYHPVKNLKVNAGVYYTNSRNVSGLKNDYTHISSVNNTHYVPYMKLVGEDGTSIAVPHFYNVQYLDTAGDGKLLDWNYYPLEDYKHNVNTGKTEDIVAHLGLDYQIAKGFNLNVMYQYQKQHFNSENHADIESYNARDLINKFSQINRATGVVTYIVPVGGILTKTYSDVGSYNFRTQFNFRKKISRHDFAAMAGSEIRESVSNGSSAGYYGYIKDPLSYVVLDPVNKYINLVTNGTAYLPTGSFLSEEINNRFVSFYSNASYIYDDKYLVSASMRKDGSNIFGANTNDRWNPLWSAGLGWEISGENFYRSTKINYLKISATYGVSGNVDISKSAVPIANSGKNQLTFLPTLSINKINDPELSWEKAYQTNVKLDFSFTGGLFSGTVEYYHKKGTNLYAPTPYDYTTWGLLSTITKNVADMNGNGIDVMLRSVISQNKLKWTANLLFNYNSSKTTAYYTTEAKTVAGFIGGGKTIQPIIGKPLYALAAYSWGGLDKNGNPLGYLNDTLSTNYTAIVNSAYNEGLDGGSFRYFGSATPVYFGALLNEFNYKGWAMSLNITYKLGYSLFKPALSYLGLAQNGSPGEGYNDRWQTPGDENTTNIPSIIYPFNTSRANFYGKTEIYVMKADHIRLQFINVSYSYHSKYRKMPQLKLYLNVANIGILWKANKDKIDPDYIGTIPDPKTFTIGLKANL